MINTITLPPFKKMCVTIGNLPTSFVESMSYYEALCWMYNYLDKTVIPAINTEGEAITELQTAFTTLKTYVDTYFENLDVQEEINNKLDAMAEDGTLADIINQEIFGEINNSISEINGDISSINDSITAIQNNELTYLVVIGDSYTAQDTSNWAELVASQLHLTLVKLATSSMGFVHAVNSTVFVDRLSEISNDIKNKVKYLICYGGINDNNENDFSTVTTAVTNFCTQAKLTCPNAQIIIAGPQIGANDAGTLKNLKCIQAIEKGARDGGVAYVNPNEWLINTQHSYHDVYKTDNLHPNSLGNIVIASKMLGVINNSTDGYFSILLTIAEGFTGNYAIKGNKDSCDIIIRLNSGTLATGDNEIASFTTPNDKTFLYGVWVGPVFSWQHSNVIGMYKLMKSQNKIYINNSTGSSINLSSDNALMFIHVVYNMTEITVS